MLSRMDLPPSASNDARTSAPESIRCRSPARDAKVGTSWYSDWLDFTLPRNSLLRGMAVPLDNIDAGQDEGLAPLKWTPGAFQSPSD